jgi:hypothetical protein
LDSPVAATEKSWMGKSPLFRAHYAAVATFLILYFSLAVSSVLEKSVTFDETAHLTAGYSYWRPGDFLGPFAAHRSICGVLHILEQFRFARLCAYLRHRERDDEVGYSILIYSLTDADLNSALHKPLAAVSR